MTTLVKAAWDIVGIQRSLEPHRMHDHVSLASVALGVANSLITGQCAYGPMIGDLENVRVALQLLLDAVNETAQRQDGAP